MTSLILQLLFRMDSLEMLRLLHQAVTTLQLLLLVLLFLVQTVSNSQALISMLALLVKMFVSQLLLLLIQGLMVLVPLLTLLSLTSLWKMHLVLNSLLLLLQRQMLTLLHSHSQILSLLAVLLIQLFLFGDVSSGAATTQTHTFKIASGNVTATGKDTGNTIASLLFLVMVRLWLSFLVVTSTSLLIQVLENSFTCSGRPDQCCRRSLSRCSLLISIWSSEDHISLLKATGTALVQNNLKNIRLYAQSGTGPLGSTAAFATTNQFSSCSSNVCSYTWTATDNLLPAVIDPSTPMTIFVKADIQGENTAKLGNDFYFYRK